MSRTCRFLIVPLMMSAASAWAGLTVTFTPPELKPGMASIETMLLEESEGFLDELLAFVEQALDKPLFMAAFTGATMTGELLSGSLGVRDGLVVSLGSSGAVWSASYGPETIAALSALGSGTDIEAGARIQPLLLQAAIPLHRALPGLRVGASLGFMDAQGAEYGIRSLSAGAFAGLSLLGGADTRSALRWKGVELSVGAGYSGGTLSAVIATGPVYQVVAIDPDGAGPLLPLSTTISVNPTITAGVATSTWGGRVSASTGVTLFDAIGVSVGAGCGYYFGSSAISIDANEAVSVEGYLSSLVETDGRVIISGSTAAVSATSFAPYLSARLSLSIGAFDIAVPFVWNIPKGLGLAVAIEAHL